MVLYVLKSVEDLIDNLDYAKFILYKYIELSSDKYYLWIRAGCLAFKGEVDKETFSKISSKLSDLKKLGKNVIEFSEVVAEDVFYTL